MKTLLSVPPALSSCYHEIREDSDQVFVTHDPPGGKLGSGGGTAHLLKSAWVEAGASDFDTWLSQEPRVMLHAGGQSRRLPAYAPLGKALLPVPVFRWSTGQQLDQTLMDLQLPLLQALLHKAPRGMKHVVASGDVLVWNESPLPEIPDVDVLCVGLWSTPETATHHGVFFTPRSEPGHFEFMLQKPEVGRIQELASTHLFLLDVGIWLFSERAIRVLLEHCGLDPQSPEFAETLPEEFDLYSSFGEALGSAPSKAVPGISDLRCAVLPLSDGEFYHFGTSGDITRSALALQNRVHDQRRIRSPLIKPHPAIFVQNAHTPCPMSADNRDIWIENCMLSPDWILHEKHVLTGIPANAWQIDLPSGICVDVQSLADGRMALRPYGFHDAFRGQLSDPETQWMGQPAAAWFRERGLNLPEDRDLQQAALFPVFPESELSGELLSWMIHGDADEAAKALYEQADKLSAEEIATLADLKTQARLRRERLREESLPAIIRHAHRSVLYQADLDHAAQLLAEPGAELAHVRPDPAHLFNRIHDHMFRARFLHLQGKDGTHEEEQAFQALRESIIAPYRHGNLLPTNTALSDQVIWARSPLRLDLAGGWTDTPPYCFLHGGSVVNLAVELNGQPPIQVFARVGKEPSITLRSIDLGFSVTLNSYEEVGAYAELGSGFSIPRAALALAGFHPDFQQNPYPSLKEQLQEFGGGIELSLLCAVPKGSGLGTSSILSATVLAALNELCGLGWDLTDIGNRSLALEQMLTSGGGWQDQFGGIVRGLKLIQSAAGLDQTPEIRWLPDHLFQDSLTQNRFLLYYSGITRVAKDILGDIVRGMFLNRHESLQVLSELKQHALDLYDSLQSGSYEELAAGVARTWELNQQLDPGTNPPVIESLLAPLQADLLGCKLLGAGGGGYVLMLAKDGDAAARIRKQLEENPPNERARFVDMRLSDQGLQVTRS